MWFGKEVLLATALLGQPLDQHEPEAFQNYNDYSLSYF